MSVEEQMTRRIKLEAIQEHAAEVAERWPFCCVLTLTVVNYYHEDVPWLLGEVERLTAECVNARTVYVVLDRDWGETPAMISIHTTLAGGVAAAAKYNRKTGDHFDIEERTVDGEEAGDE